ncbi:MAG: VOC family protein [Candidatus Kapaibacterium sp.]
MAKGKITGIGGIFFKCDDPVGLRNWYAENFDISTNEYGAMFQFREAENPDKKAYLQWSTFSKDSDYLQPSEKEFMINYRVTNIEDLVESLKAKGIKVIGNIQEFEYGKFAHVMDPEGNKIELWEPVDTEFDNDYNNRSDKG